MALFALMDGSFSLGPQRACFDEGIDIVSQGNRLLFNSQNTDQ
jgi:hypothetical protein